MISAVKAHLTAKLVAAGLPATRVTDDPGKGDWPPGAAPYAEILAGTERLARRGKPASRVYDAQTQQATVTTRLFERMLPVTVALFHTDEPKLDALVSAFLNTLERGFEDSGQFIRVSPGQIVWNAWRGERPANRHRADLRIECAGGLYTTDPGGTLQELNPPTVAVT